VIATIIVVGSVALAGVFAAVWWLRPALRAQIEAPGQQFAAAARRYDKVCRATQRQASEANDG
jgi:hypothetical protein